MPELSQVVICHFGDVLERALREAYEELFGSPIPSKLIITLPSTSDQPQRLSHQSLSKKRRTTARRRNGGIGQGGPSRRTKTKLS